MSADTRADNPAKVVDRRFGRMAALWAALFLGVGFLLWIGIRFLSPSLRAAVQPNAEMGRAPALPALFPTDSGPIFDLGAVVQSNAPAGWIGRRVEFTDVTIVGTEGSAFRIRDREGHALFSASWSSQPPGLSIGKKVRISGLILTLPSPQIMEEQWRVSTQTAAAMQREKIYLRASTIEKQ